MADRIHVSTEWLDRCANELNAINGSISGAARTLSGTQLRRDEGGNLRVSLSCNLKMTGGGYSGSNATEDIRQLQSAIQALSSAVNGFSGGVRQASNLFNSTERQAVSLARGIGNSKTSEIYERDGAGSSGGGGGKAGGRGGNSDGSDSMELIPGLILAMGYPMNTKLWTPEMIKNYQAKLENAIIYTSGSGNRVFMNDGMIVVSDRYGNVSVRESAWNKLDQRYFNADGSYAQDERKLKFTSMLWKDKADRDDIWSDHYDNSGRDGYKLPSRKKTLFEVSAEQTITKSTFHKDFAYEDEYNSISGSFDFNKRSATAKVSGGLYRTEVDKNGKAVRVLEPGVAAEIGVSYSLFEASMKGRTGNDFAGIDYGVSAKGPSASAKVTGELGIVDHHVAAHVSASAEVIGGEIGGEIGADVMGVEAKVKGTVNYGIGGHADIGAHDGTISCDIGLSVGIGASVKLEIDYGKAIDKAAKKVSGLINGLKGKSRGLFGGGAW